MTEPGKRVLRLIQGMYLTVEQKNKFIEMNESIRHARDRQKKQREEEQRMAPSPEAFALAQVAADQLQEWLPGYPILIAGDGQVKIDWVNRGDGRSIMDAAFVMQAFQVEFNDGSTKRYGVSVTIREMDDDG